jgi:DNA-binding transcriptional LysR family regulator
MLDRQTLHFLKIAEFGSLAVAARELGIGQPALTRSLQSLEQRLGATLFERLARGVTLTPTGKVFRNRVLTAQLTLDDAMTEISSMTTGMTGKVRIGVGLAVADMVSDALFPRLLRNRPAAQVLLHTALNMELFELVESGHLDFAICGVLTGVPDSLSTSSLFTDKMQVVVRTGHPLKDLRTPQLADVAQYSYVSLSGKSSNQAMIAKRLIDLGIRPRHASIETNSMETVLKIVSKTDMFAILPWSATMNHQWGHCLTSIDVPDLSVERSVGLVFRAGGYVSPLTEYVTHLIAESLKGQSMRNANARAEE